MDDQLILGLLYNAFLSCLGYEALNDRLFVNDEFEKMWEIMVVACFKLSYHLFGETMENNEKPHDSWPQCCIKKEC
jgi:hypothetical protein